MKLYISAHLMCIKRRGVCLYGEEIDNVFGDVSWDNFKRAVLYDFDWITENENICESPYYGVLNICRLLQIITENNEKYPSKYEGALWGIANLPTEYTPVIKKALEVYASAEPIDGITWDKSALLMFRDYARGKLYEY